MKKKNIIMMTLTMMFCLFVMSQNVYAADVYCAAIPDAAIDESVPNLVSMVVKVIHIAVPVILVVMGSIDLMKGIIAQKEDEIKKGQQTFVKRLIAAIIVFFVIAVVKFVISAVAGTDSDIMQCANCFLEGSKSTSCERP